MLHPSQVVGPDLKELCLAYISIPNMLEHYNTCEPMTTVYEDGDNTGENCPTSVAHDTGKQFYATPAQIHIGLPEQTTKFVTPVKKKIKPKTKGNS